MLIKSKSGKSKRALKNTLRYILAKEDPKSIGFVMNRFIRGDKPFEALMENAEGNLEKHLVALEKRVDNMVRQFEKNEEKRKIKRKNSNLFYHEIIAFHPEDAKHLPKKTLLKIARKYAKERAPNSIVVSSMHADKKHYHIHQVISALEFATGKPLHLSRKEFKEVKLRMEKWQEQELGLEHSKVAHHKRSHKMAELEIERQLNLRGKQSERQQISLKVLEAFAQSNSKKHFYERLHKLGLETYERSGKVVGVYGNKRKYRLQTLGFSEYRIRELDNQKEKNKTRNRLRELNNERPKGQELDL